MSSRHVLTESQINTLAGAASGAFVSVLVSPLDVVKTRIQVKRLPKGVPDTPLLTTMYRLAQQEGFRAFFKGLGTTMLVGHHGDRIHLVGSTSCSRVTYRTGRSTSVPINGRRNSTPLTCHSFTRSTIC